MNDDANFSNNDSESNRRITHDFSRDEDTKFHTLAYKFDPEKEVQIRILSDWDIPYDFKVGKSYNL